MKEDHKKDKVEDMKGNKGQIIKTLKAIKYPIKFLQSLRTRKNQQNNRNKNKFLSLSFVQSDNN